MTLPTIKELDYPVNCLALNRVFPQRYPYLLESTVSGDSDNTRFDILFAFPGETLRWEQLHSPAIDNQPDFLSRLNTIWQQAAKARSCPDELPFAGGWFVYLGYEIAAEIEHRLRLPRPETGLPHAFATRIPIALINDHELKKAYLVAEFGVPLPDVQVEANLHALVLVLMIYMKMTHGSILKRLRTLSVIYMKEMSSRSTCHDSGQVVHIPKI